MVFMFMMGYFFLYLICYSRVLAFFVNRSGTIGFNSSVCLSHCRFSEHLNLLVVYVGLIVSLAF